LVTYGIRTCIKAIGLLDESILRSDHIAIFIDLDLLFLFGPAPERLERPQFRNLKVDDLRISDSYRKLLHKQFECQNIYERVKKISERRKADYWSLEDEHAYKTLDRDITAAMLWAAEKCSIQKEHNTSWPPSLSKATHAIRYWPTRMLKNGIQYADDCVLEYYLEHSYVDASNFDKTMSVKACDAELRNTKARFKDVLADAISNSDLFEVEVSTAMVERRYPHFTEDNVLQVQEREERIDKEVRQRETRRSTQKSFRKLGYQIRGHVKPNSMKKSCLNRMDVQMEDGIWRQIVRKGKVTEHLIERNVEQLSHAGATPLGYTELGHTGETPMFEATLEGTFDHEALSDDALAAIVKQLRKHSAVRQIVQPIVTEENFASTFKCVPEKTASSFYGRGVHHYNDCAKSS
jgi:hypothetical protein